MTLENVLQIAILLGTGLAGMAFNSLRREVSHVKEILTNEVAHLKDRIKFLEMNLP